MEIARKSVKLVVMKTWNITDKQELAEIAKDVKNELLEKDFGDQAKVLLLNGDLGAGKTTFTGFLAKEFGITDTITSPTFVIMNCYEMPSARFIHTDWYRLEEEKDLVPLDFDTYLNDPRNILVIEWSSNIPSKIPTNAVTLDFVWKGENEREVKML